MVDKLGAKIEKYAKNFGEGKGRWWERMKTAGKKNSLARYMVGVERAKTLVMDVEIKIMMYDSSSQSFFSQCTCRVLPWTLHIK
jgi:hypothetical protein